MASLDSNSNEVAAAIKELLDGVRFDAPGRDQSLGRDLVGIVASGIIDRTVAEQKEIGGSPLKENEDMYAKRKARLYSSHQPLIRTGQMMSLTSIIGDTTISADAIEMVYGTGRAPTSGSTGTITDADKAVTDRDKAKYTSPERPFYGLDQAIADAVEAEARAFLEQHLE